MKQNRSICGDKNPRWSGGLITIYCDNCGNTLYRKKSAVLEHNFCNQKCVAAWKSNQKTSSNVALVEGGKVKVQCDFCGGDIIKKASHAKNLNFCNRTCQAGWRKQNKSGKNSPRWRERVNIICDNCGGEIQREKHLINERNFCDMYCYFEWGTGENSSTWQGGVSFGKYCQKFNANFKKRVRLFFKNTCVICGEHYEDGRNMDVHHVNYDTTACCNNELPLFVTLCHSCHGKTNKRSDREMWKIHFTELIHTNYGGKCYLTKKEYKNLMRCNVAKRKEAQGMVV